MPDRQGLRFADDSARNVPLGNFMTTFEVAELTGLTINTLHMYRQPGRGRGAPMPHPDAWVNGMPLWRRTAVVKWHSQRQAAAEPRWA